MNWIRIAVTAAFAFVAASAAHAITVNVSSISGTWENAVTTNGSASGEGTNMLSWGDPCCENAGGDPSSYEFNAAGTGVKSSPFVLGEFVHNNFTISSDGASLQSADLQVSIAGTAGGVGFSLMPLFSFTHFETPNNPSGGCAAGGVPLCPDLVTLVNSQDLSETFEVDGDLFTLTILGFETEDGVFSTFLTNEQSSNKAKLIASFAVEPGGGSGGQIPLPAGAWLMLTGVGLLGAAKRRTKKA